ncbi:hypothetical protein B0A55_05326, partial [Friedmanniomyces simplex]
MALCTLLLDSLTGSSVLTLRDAERAWTQPPALKVFSDARFAGRGARELPNMRQWCQQNAEDISTGATIVRDEGEKPPTRWQKVAVGVATWRLVPNSPRSGQFMDHDDDRAHERPTFDAGDEADKDQVGIDKLDKACVPLEKNGPRAHRVYHPLEIIPQPARWLSGPKLAAVSKAYQFYFDVLKKGKLPWELVRLHERYGPIVRIGPNEVHVSDPKFYDILYASLPARRHKDIFAIDGFGLAQSVIATANHEHHRMRRAALNPFFSTQAVAALEQSAVRPKIDEACQAFEKAFKSGEPVDIEVLTLALTTDIISQYAFAKS